MSPSLLLPLLELGADHAADGRVVLAVAAHLRQAPLRTLQEILSR